MPIPVAWDVLDNKLVGPHGQCLAPPFFATLGCKHSHYPSLVLAHKQEGLVSHVLLPLAESSLSVLQTVNTVDLGSIQSGKEPFTAWKGLIEERSAFAFSLQNQAVWSVHIRDPPEADMSKFIQLNLQGFVPWITAYGRGVSLPCEQLWLSSASKDATKKTREGQRFLIQTGAFLIVAPKKDVIEAFFKTIFIALGGVAQSRLSGACL